MLRVFSLVLLTAGFCLSGGIGCAFAGEMTGSKGLKVDPLLKQAIIDTAREVDEVPAEPPIFEEEAMGPPQQYGPPEPPPPPPVEIVEEAPPERDLFTWPEKPGQLWGGVLFLPSLLVKSGWTDNLFARDEAIEESDVVTHVMPRLRIEIPDIRHDIALEGSWEWRTHIKNNDENQHNLAAKFMGALNAEKGLSVPFEFGWESRHEERQEDLAGDHPERPLEQESFHADSGLRFKPGGFGIALLGHYKKDRFEDGFAEITRAPVIRRDADRDITQLEFNTSFDLDPENTLMLWGTYGTRDYEQAHFQAGGFTGPRRTSDTYSGMLSWMFDFANLDGHMSIGVNDYSYEDPAISDAREIVGDLEFDHRISELTTVNFQFARSIEEDVEIADPLIRSRAGFYIDYQAWDDVLLAAGADYNFLEFNTSARDDETWDFRAIADYFINDFIAFGAEYVYTLRDSEAAGLDFRRSMFLLRARGRL